MKKSLTLRFILIVVVLLAWAVSLFPLKDKPFLETFQRLASSRIEKYREAVETGAEEVESLRQLLDEIEDKDSKEAKDLQEQLSEAEAELGRNTKLVRDYDQILGDAAAMMDREEDPVRAEFLALQAAARGSEDEPAIPLYKYVPITGVPQASNALVISHVREKARATLRKGLDLGGGTEFILGFDEDSVPEDRTVEQITNQIVEIMRNRVDTMGVVEPEIKPLGGSSISLTMPTTTEGRKAEIRETITQTAKLTFHLVHPNNQTMVAEYERNPDAFVRDPEYVLKTIRNVRPDGSVEVEKVFITKKPSRVRGGDVKRAVGVYMDLQGYVVSLTFNDRGARAFGDLTKQHKGERLAIVLDGKVYSAPQIKEAILGGQAQITGNFSPEEANRLAGVISSGDLPVTIKIDSEFGTDPVLGRDSIRSGTWAAIGGLLAVLVFMVVYYRFAGVIAVSALASNILLVFGTLALSGATITLPGIAGIVLTIGMAVDANVLIFERIREELRNGKSLGNSIKSGYRRALVTIMDANLTTLITAGILYKVGTGPIRGFAVTLSIGIIASMFTALFMTRAIFDLLLFKGWLKKLTMMSLVSDPTFDFLKYRKVALGVSVALLVVCGLVAAIRGGSVLSIDFAGGTQVAYRITGDEKPDQKAIAQALSEIGHTDCRVGYKYAGGTEAKMLEIVLPERSTNEQDLDLAAIGSALNSTFKNASFEQVQTVSIGGLIGEEFRNKAIWAGVLAIVAIVIYVSFRFELAYGIASVVALVHDVLIAAGIYLALGRQLSLPVVAALLTIMGYSLNDTIVVFDRIREDLGLLKRKSYSEIINLSINQTLARTLLTSLTTLMVVVILVWFGGGAINDFAVVMLIGVIVGTYSSIFVASAIIAIWHRPSHGHDEKAAAVTP